MKKPLDHCLWCGNGLLLTLMTVCTKPLYIKHSMRGNVKAPAWCMCSPFVSLSPALAVLGEPRTVIQQNIPKVSGWAICAYQ